MELVILTLTGCDQAPLRGQQPEKPPALPEDRYSSCSFAILVVKHRTRIARDRYHKQQNAEIQEVMLSHKWCVAEEED